MVGLIRQDEDLIIKTLLDVFEVRIALRLHRETPEIGNLDLLTIWISRLTSDIFMISIIRKLWHLGRFITLNHLRAILAHVDLYVQKGLERVKTVSVRKIKNILYRDIVVTHVPIPHVNAHVAPLHLRDFQGAILFIELSNTLFADLGKYLIQYSKANLDTDARILVKRPADLLIFIFINGVVSEINVIRVILRRFQASHEMEQQES